MSDSAAGVGKKNMSLEYHVVPKSKEVLKIIIMGMWQWAGLKQPALGKPVTIWASKQMAEMEHNPLNKVGTHEFIVLIKEQMQKVLAGSSTVECCEIICISPPFLAQSS